MPTELDACIRHAAKSLAAIDKNLIGEAARYDRVVLEIEWLAEVADVPPPHRSADAVACAVSKDRSAPFIETLLRGIFANLPKATSAFERSPFAFGDSFALIFGGKQ